MEMPPLLIKEGLTCDDGEEEIIPRGDLRQSEQARTGSVEVPVRNPRKLRLKRQGLGSAFWIWSLGSNWLCGQHQRCTIGGKGPGFHPSHSKNTQMHAHTYVD